MNTPIEQTVRELLHDSARRARVPLPDLATVVREAERETRQARGRRVLLVAAAAVLAGILAVLPWSTGRDEGLPTRPVPSGPTTTPVSGTPGESAPLVIGFYELSIRGQRSDDGWTAVVSGRRASDSPVEVLRTITVPFDGEGAVSALGLGGDTVMLVASPEEPAGVTPSGGIERSDSATVSVPGTPLSVAAVLLAPLDPRAALPSLSWRDPFGGTHEAGASGSTSLGLPSGSDVVAHVRSLAVETTDGSVRVSVQATGRAVDPTAPLVSGELVLGSAQDAAFALAPSGQDVYGVTRLQPDTADVRFSDGLVPIPADLVDRRLESVEVADGLWLVGIHLDQRLNLAPDIRSLTWRDTAGGSHPATVD